MPNPGPARYVDGFVVPVPTNNLAAYLRLARAAARVWREHGALDYKECVGDDLDIPMCLPFPRGIRTKPGETVVFAWISYRSRAHRDRVNAKVMKDPRIQEACASGQMPFDGKRMLYGGFKVAVQG
ncbi:MAG TPA: DUF1428 domain-containing protein [Verrucomicrobiota bacterium]|nr:DUF1428 domain-containing protein [Verrucomicrobiota bacterium]